MATSTIANLTELAATSVTDAHWFVIDNGTTTSKLNVFDSAVKSIQTVGTGASVLSNLGNMILSYRTLSGSSPITVTQSTNDIAISLNESAIDITALSNIASFDLSAADNSSSLFLSSVDLTSDVTGTLPVANGGTGKTSFSTNSVLLGGTTIREATLNSDLKVVVGTTSGPEVKTLQGDSDRITVTQNNTSDTVTVAFDDTDIVTSGADATLGNVTVNALTVGSLSASSAGAVTQTTNLNTGVTLNAVAGSITLATGVLAASTLYSFVVTNSAVTSNSVIFLSPQFDTSAYTDIKIYVSVKSVADGNFVINLHSSHNADTANILRKIHFFVFG